MKKLGILLLAAAFAVCGLMTFAACNEETPGPGDDPIVTPGPDDPGKPDDPTPPDEPEATEGLVFELLTTENSDGFEEFFGEGFEDFYACIGMTAAEENVVIPSTYNGLPVRMVQWFDWEPEISNRIDSFYFSDSVQMILFSKALTFENLTEIRLPRNPNAMIEGDTFSNCAFYNDPNNWEDGALYMDDWLLATNADLPEVYTVKQGTYGIASGAFYGSSVKKVTVPDGVQVLVGSFANCASLEEVVPPDTLSSIGYQAFYDCYSLTSINIPDGVTSIGYQAFYDCNSLTSIVIPDSVTSIGDWAFSSCDSLTSITIGDGVTSIGDWAFSGCDSLTTITIPDSVTSIGFGAFVGCSSLESVTIGDSVTSIGDSAFSGCSGLTSIVIPDSVTSIGEGAFSGCNSLTSFIVNTGNAVYHSDGNCLIETQSKTLIAGCGASVIPSDGSVISIGDSAFGGCSRLTSIVIPDSVISIGDEAFAGCDSLTSIVIPDSVTSIGESAFLSCDSLTSIVIPDSVTSIGESAFLSCDSLTSVTIGDGVTSIGHRAFRDCRSLTSITIPDSVTTIGDWAFSNCSLETVYYRGSEAEWNEIEIKEWNDALMYATIIFNYTGE